MKITVNSKSVALPEEKPTSVQALVTLMDLPAAGIALAVNGKVVRKAEWDAVFLSEGDAVTVIRAVCGG